MRNIKITSLMTMYFLISGCEETLDTTLPVAETDLIVVEAILTNERTNHLVKLTRPYKAQNEMPEPITGAVVRISDESNVALLQEYPEGSGYYYTPLARAVAGRTYRLSVAYNGKFYFAEDRSVPVEPMPRLEYKKTGSNEFTLRISPSGADPNFIEYDLAWNDTPNCISGSVCNGRIVYYDLKTIDVNELFKPEKSEFTFPKLTQVIRKKYSVSPAYQRYLRSMLSETEWRGGFFDVQHANASTNLSAGAVGFFAVSTVLSDTTIIRE